MRTILIFSILLSLVFSSKAQITITADDKNMISYLDKKISFIRMMFGKPDSIERDSVTQFFCGMTRGRYEKLIYSKHAVSFNTWKRLGYVSGKNLNPSRPRVYYKNCSVRSITIKKESSATINNFRLSDFTTENIDSLLKGEDAYLNDKYYECRFPVNDRELKLVFTFNDEGKAEEMTFDIY